MLSPACERLYRIDPFLTSFPARLTRITAAAEGLVALELDRTAFYPTGGGQPHDTGRIGGLRITDVREAGDGRIEHLSPSDPGVLKPGDEVEGSIDWPRRFDHMQQHSGQHILSRSVLRQAGAATRSFHLGEKVCTIDVELAQPDEDALKRAEAEANAVIASDTAVAIRLIPPGEAPRLAADAAVARELALAPGEPIRLIGIGDYDETPCGGTHVRAAGQVGAVLLRSWERFKGGTRITFLCGGRVVSEAARLATLVDRCGARLSCPADELPDAIARLQDQLAQSRLALKRRSEALAALEAEALDRRAAVAGDWRVAAAVLPGRTMEEIQRLARLYVEPPGRAALLAAVPAEAGRCSLIFARSAVPAGGPSMGALMTDVCRAHGGKGGGAAELATGGGLPPGAAEAAVEEALRRFGRPGPA